MNAKIYRIIDANANRLREALRVCEDIARFILSDKKTTQEFKSLRHKTSLVVKSLCNKNILAKFRDPERDIGKKTIKSELKREDVTDVFRANVKRAEESIRVLEEFSKLLNPKLADRLKDIRFKIYSLEKALIEKL